MVAVSLVHACRPFSVGLLALVLSACGGGDSADGTVVASGAVGANGANGLTALVQVTIEAPGSNCTHGGNRIAAGMAFRGLGFKQLEIMIMKKWLKVIGTLLAAGLLATSVYASWQEECIKRGCTPTSHGCEC